MKFASFITLLTALLVGCHSHDDCEGHSHDPMCLVCEGDEDTFDTARLGEEGNFEIQLISGEPDPHLVGNNVLVLQVLDAEGDPVDDVTWVKIEPFTPQGGHGTSIDAEVASTPEPGVYEISELNYVHLGIWEVRFELEAGGLSDRIVFTFCIEEPA